MSTLLGSGAMAALLGLAASLALAAVTWVVSLAVRKASIADSTWAFFVLSPAVIYAAMPLRPDPRATLALLLAAAWATRLSGYITWRNWGKPEDRRYQKIRARNEPGFAVKSLYIVFATQGVLAWVVAMPFLAILRGRTLLGWLDAIGVAVVVLGIAFETVADWQLARFKSGNDPDGVASGRESGLVMDRGLWRYSRHPNYFGEFCVWWGFYVIAVSAGGWWTVVSPLLMSALLVKISGVTLIEADLDSRKPKYREYVGRTNAFFPGPPR